MNLNHSGKDGNDSKEQADFPAENLTKVNQKEALIQQEMQDKFGK